MYVRWFVIFFAVIVLTSCQTGSAVQSKKIKVPDEKLLSSRELKKVFSGNKMVYTNRNGILEEDYFYKDGSMQSEDAGQGSDSGKWWIEEPNTFCRQWNRWADGRKICSQVTREGDTYYRVRSGVTFSRSFKVMKQK